MKRKKKATALLEPEQQELPLGQRVTKATGVPAEQLAKILQLSIRQVYAHAANGLFPRVAPGRFDLARSMLAYLRFQAEEIERRFHGASPGAISGLQQERTRLTRVKADRIEHELKEMRASHIPAWLFEKELDAMRTDIERHLLDTFTPLAPHLEGLTRREIEERLDTAARGLLSSMALRGVDAVA